MANYLYNGYEFPTGGNMKKGRLRCSTHNISSPIIKSGIAWAPKSLHGLNRLLGNHIWSDGTNIYYSSGNQHYVLNGDTWDAKTWNGLASFYGEHIWTDGTNIYYSYSRLDNIEHYVLNGDTWVEKTWNISTKFYGNNVWADGINIYYSDGVDEVHYVLNGDIWEPKTWNGYTTCDGNYIWSDGTNIYYSGGNFSSQYALNGDTWVEKTWNSPISGSCIWSDGTNIYYSSGNQQYALNGDTWVEKTWDGYLDIYGSCIWSDGTNIYYASGETNYILTSSGYYPVPEVYVPYVNTAKNIFDVQCGKEYSNIAVAENQNYISVHFLTDDFSLVSYDPETTIYTATGIAFVTYDKRTDKWSADVVDNMESVSEGSRYISHWVWSEVDVQWNGVAVFTTTYGLYYNSVKLPSVDDVLTDTSRPYLVIYKETYNKYVIVATSVPLIHTNSKICSPVSTHYYNYICYASSNLGWRQSASYSDTTIDLSDKNEFVWANYDILNEDGSVYIPASEPVHVTYVVEEDDDVTSYDVLNFQIGLTLGLCGKGIVDSLSVDGEDSSLDSASFEAGYKAGAELRRLRS